MKVAFLDRDGTINKDYPDDEWRSVTEPELLDGTLTGLLKLSKLGYKFIILTNQYIIQDKIITEDDYSLFQDKLLTMLRQNQIEILATYHCPHRDGCNCRKPKPGMLEQALKDFDIDLENSIYCGDSRCDYLLAKQFNLKFFGINYKGMETDVIHCLSLADVPRCLKV